jgi:ubiquitin-protein ligase
MSRAVNAAHGRRQVLGSLFVLLGLCRRCRTQPSEIFVDLLPTTARTIQDEGWRPSITIRQVLTGIQSLLAEPNELSPAQEDAYLVFTKRPTEYRQRVLAQAQKYVL